MSDHTPDTATVLECFMDGAAGEFTMGDFFNWLDYIRANNANKGYERAMNEVRRYADNNARLYPFTKTEEHE